MNLIQVQEQLKGLPTQAIMAYANGQNPEVPPYVALAELNRRKQLEQSSVRQMSGQKPTIKDQVEQSVGLMGLQQAQQKQAMQQAAQSMPVQGVPQGAPEGPVQGAPEGFAGGGAVAFNGEYDSYVDTDPNDMYLVEPEGGGGGDGISEWAKKIRDAREAIAAEEASKPKMVRVPGRGFQMVGGESEPKVAPAVDQTSAETARLQRQNAGIAAAIPPKTNNPFATGIAANIPPKGNVPPPAVVAKNIAQGKPAAPNLATVMESAASKLQPSLIAAINEGLSKGQTIDEAINDAKRYLPVSPHQEKLIKSLEAERAEQLARRQAPKTWYENEGLMAALRGFAQADPRRPLGAAGAAYTNYEQQLRAQRAAEDAAYRQGLLGLSNAEEARNAKLLEYGIGRLSASAEAKRNAITAGTQMTDAAMRQAQSDANHRAQMAQVEVGRESNRIAKQAQMEAKQQGLDQQAAAAIGKLAADYYDKTFKGSEYLYNTPEKQQALQDRALEWARRAYTPKSGSAAPKTYDWNQIPAPK